VQEDEQEEERLDNPHEALLGLEHMWRNKEVIDSIFAQDDDAPPESLNPRHAEIKAMLLYDSLWLPWRKVGVLVAIFAWLVVTGVMRDTVHCGGVLYWLLAPSVVPFAMVVMFLVRRWLIGKQELCNEVRVT
jgi:hypothetical protein